MRFWLSSLFLFLVIIFSLLRKLFSNVIDFDNVKNSLRADFQSSISQNLIGCKTQTVPNIDELIQGNNNENLILQIFPSKKEITLPENVTPISEHKR